MPSSGSSTSPLPVMISDAVRSATASIASSRRSTRSERQSFASSTAERVEMALVLVELAFEALEQRERVGGRAGEAGQHAILMSRRTLRAVAFTTTLPSVTWPSPPSATLLPRRTERIVVP